jgi:hypothetical protein
MVRAIGSAIDLAPIADRDQSYELPFVVNHADEPVIADPVGPETS